MKNKKDDQEIAITALGELPSGSVITEQQLAHIFNRHPLSIKRAVARGELPPPTKMFGKPTWTSDSILRHIDALLDQAKEEQQKLENRLRKHTIG